MWWVGVWAAWAGVALAASDAPVPGRREPAAEVQPLFRGLRERAARAAVTGDGTARVYVLVAGLTPERRAALEAAGLAIEVPPPGSPAPRWREGVVVQGVATEAAARAIAALLFVRGGERPG